ncbi:MAG: peptidylprolyl isomerase, partial [bacterium]|nr:peptidylprolyl isomerase [Candidatus Kapabacteria bacterium]
MPTIVMAQEGKPLYTITVFRAGDSIGEIDLELFPDVAPQHVRNFDSLVSIRFYDGTAFHRVIPGFMIQGGDPNTRSGHDTTWGFGDPSQRLIPAEFNPIKHERGILSAARSNEPNSATSQFFICHATAANLDGAYSVHGRVVRGLNIVDAVALTPTVLDQFGKNSRPAQKITMTIRRTGIDTSITTAPTLVSPSNDTSRVKVNLDLRWTRVDSALMYRVQVSNSADFSTLLIRDSTSDLTYSARALPQGQQTLYWRVSSSNGGRRSEFSETRMFTTAISASRLLSPESAARGVQNPVPL